MKTTLRLPLPDKKGIQRRIDSAVRQEGEKVLHACVDGIVLSRVLSHLGKIPRAIPPGSESAVSPHSSQGRLFRGGSSVEVPAGNLAAEVIKEELRRQFGP